METCVLSELLAVVNLRIVGICDYSKPAYYDIIDSEQISAI